MLRPFSQPGRFILVFFFGRQPASIKLRPFPSQGGLIELFFVASQRHSVEASSQPERFILPFWGPGIILASTLAC